MTVATLPREATTDEILSQLTADGAVIVSDVIDRKTVQQMTDETMPYIENTPMGGDDFTGRKTQRTGALIARSPTCQRIVLHPLVIGTTRKFLAPFTKKILLHLTQTIRIHPGSAKQTLHRDRFAWGSYLPKSIEPQLNTIWALTEFTEENGATRCIPGSHTWDWEERANPDQFAYAEMSPGSVFFYTGSILHSGGANNSNHARLGVNLTYCLGWLRQEENQYLSCPPDIAKNLEPELQDLLGYTQGDFALGYYSDPYSADGGPILGPESVVGRARSDTKEFGA